MTERAFQRQVLAYLALCRWQYIHQRPARTAKGWRTAIEGHMGFPDIVAVRGPRLVFIELKVGKNKPTPEQEHWLDLLRQTQAEVYLWRPEDWDTILEVMR